MTDPETHLAILEDALDARVAELRATGMGAEEVQAATRGEWHAAAQARSEAFAHATQGRHSPGRRLSYGTGKPPTAEEKALAKKRAKGGKG